MKQNHPSLLPNGLLDLLPPQAEAEARTIDLFLQSFGAFGYARVKPPLVEFEESLLGAGPGQSLASQTFRMMDPVSGRMMGVRADVTAQIARIATSRLGDEQRPLRLSYAADVLRVNGTQLRPERQFCQAGCELIGVDSIATDVEMPLVALKAMSDAGIQNLSVDLTVPTLITHLFEGTDTNEGARQTYNDLIEKRDRDAIAAMDTRLSKLIVSLMEHDDLSKIDLPHKAKADVEKLLTVAKDLRDALDVYGLHDVQITIDPLERRGFEYQTGISFTLFAKGASGELGRGGRYDVDGRGLRAAETATGFTLYMDTIMKAVPASKPSKAETVDAKASWKDIKYLQDQGVKVSRRG
jgi:ATP phosphoribosyltransferase regulatory subunit